MQAPDFTKMVPGFDFLQNLLEGARAGMPAMSQWIAPTLDAEEVDKRIQELRTVQYWLEQNSRMLGATIQALEVQRMTLATLKTMNMPVNDLRDSMKIDPQAFVPPAPAPSPSAPAAPAAAKPRTKAPARKAPAETQPAAPAMVDPMQWWGALTQQFAELASNAIKDAQTAAAPVAATAAAAASPSAAPAATPKAGKARGAGSRSR